MRAIRVVRPSVTLFTPPLKIFLGRTPPLGDQREGWRAEADFFPSQPSFRGPDLFFEFSLKFYPPLEDQKEGWEGWGRAGRQASRRRRRILDVLAGAR